jgi:hypothetical protein
MKFREPIVFRVESLTEEQKGYLFLLNACIDNLQIYEREFAATILLFNFARAQSFQNPGESKIDKIREAVRAHRFEEVRALREQQKDATEKHLLYAQWQMIAARDGAMTLYHFGVSVQYVGALVRKIPQIDQHVEQEKLREARKILKKHFPGFKAIRHTVSHLSDFMGSIEEFKKHSLKKSINFGGYKIEPGGLFANNLSGETLLTTYRGDQFSYNISQESLDAMTKIVDLVFLAFRNPELSRIRRPS